MTITTPVPVPKQESTTSQLPDIYTNRKNRLGGMFYKMSY